MVRLLVKLGAWLDKRFPEKVMVTAWDYASLKAKVDALEHSSVHVENVKVVISEIQKLKDELASLKTSLGINGMTRSSPVAEAYLNDLPTGVYDDNER